MKIIISLVAILINLCLHAQISGTLAMNAPERYNNKELNYENETDTLTKTFSNSEPEGITFFVSSNIKKTRLFIKTNYAEKYNVRFIDYYGHSKKLYKNNFADMTLDLTEFNGSIIVINIYGAKSNKLLTSQIVNLKRKMD